MRVTTVPVLVPVPLDTALDYRVPAEAVPPVGSFVRVPVAGREVVGVVWDEAGQNSVAENRLKPVRAVFDAPPMSAVIRDLIRHVARETLAPLGSVARLAMSVPAALDPWPTKPGYRRTADALPERITAPRRRVLDTLAGEVMTGPDLAKAAGVGAAVLKGMAKDGLIDAVAVVDRPFLPAPDPAHEGVTLSAAQAAAAKRLVAGVEARRHGVVLLEGVPGAGKTEVYFEAVAAALRAGRRVLVLLPEIALSAQWLERFERRFGAAPAVWHSGLTAVQRRRTWRSVAEGRVSVLVGARSALFLPLTDLGLVVVDEEHDPSFKQGDGVVYNARDMAVARAKLEGCLAVLTTATPAVETAASAGAVTGGPAALEGWSHTMLPARHAGALMPTIKIVDLRRDRPPRGGFLSPPLRDALEQTLARAGQSLLFLNRRGYAPLTLCRACGYRLACPSCSAWLVAHRMRGRLQCHHCGWNMPTPEHCPSCGAVDSLAVSGPGVERLAEEVTAFLPQARLALMTSDTVTSVGAAADLVRAMTDREIDVLIGTQIIAKGHHFPALTLVGVVDADIGLGGGDLRAGERTFQMLYQVAGRAGRESRPGRVLIQTHLPDHSVMQALASSDKDRFLAVEYEERKAAHMPPCGRLAALIFSGRDHEQVKAVARDIAASAPEDPDVLVLGPAPAPLSLLRGRWRERLLVKAEEEVDLPSWLRRWLAGIKLPSAVQLQIDVDPLSFL
ncbi:MAG: primosomal protein N' [Geminicoccaceae bacterium]